MQRQPCLLTVSVLRHGLLHYIIEESMAKALYFFDLTVRTRRRQLSVWHLAVMRSISQRVRWIRTPPAKCLRYSRDKVVLRSAAAGGRIVVVYCTHCSLSFADTSHSVRTRFNDTVHRRRSRSRGERGLWGPYVLPRITRQSQIRTFST